MRTEAACFRKMEQAEVSSFRIRSTTLWKGGSALATTLHITTGCVSRRTSRASIGIRGAIACLSTEGIPHGGYAVLRTETHIRRPSVARIYQMRMKRKVCRESDTIQSLISSSGALHSLRVVLNGFKLARLVSLAHQSFLSRFPLLLPYSQSLLHSDHTLSFLN